MCLKSSVSHWTGGGASIAPIHRSAARFSLPPREGESFEIAPARRFIALSRSVRVLSSRQGENLERAVCLPDLTSETPVI